MNAKDALNGIINAANGNPEPIHYKVREAIDKARHAPPLPSCPEPIRRKPVPEDQKPTDAAKDDLQLAAYGVCEFGTAKQVAKAYRMLRTILDDTRD